MKKTFTEARPTAVTVIGWAWIILGAFMLLSAGMGLVMSLTVPPPDPALLDGEAPFAGIWRYFWLLATVQLGVAGLGVFAGLRLLALQSWARTALELLSWLAILALVGYAIFWVINSYAVVGAEADELGFARVFAFAGVGVTMIYAVPVGFMIYHLRSAKVRAAVGGP